MKSDLLLLYSFFSAFFTLFAHGSVSEPGVARTNRIVQVCFADPTQIAESQFSYYFEKDDSLKEWSEETKRIVKKTILANYTATLTGISYAGWKNCDANTEKAVVRVHYGEFSTHAGLATLGENGGLAEIRSGSSRREIWMKNPNEKLSPFVAIALGGGANEFKMGILHEFGHLAGLRHEHVRDEARDDANCHSPFIYLNEPMQSSTRLTGSYDSKSIMSYCYKDFAFRRLGAVDDAPTLTAGDRATLRSLYP